MIPVVDISGASDTFAQDLADACSEIGFVAITGHGVDQTLLADMRATVEDLFGLSDEVKAANRIQPGNYRGFIPLGFFTPNRSDDNDDGDAYEGFKLHWECPVQHPVIAECDLYGPNRWIAQVPAMREVVLRYWAACDVVSHKLLSAFAASLALDGPDFLQQFEAPITNMTLLHYPPHDPADDVTSFHPHKDTCALTILYPDPVGGLRLQRRDGGWIDAQCPPDALLINTGDMMELWSGGRFVSTPHQVVNTTGQERYSFPHFVVPNHAAVVQPLVDPVPGFDRLDPIPVGHWSAEVWRTNWPDELPADETLHLGGIDGTAS